MPSSRVVHVRTDDTAVVDTLRRGIEQIQKELEVTPEFPAEVEAAAARAAAAPRLPELDRTEIPFITIDPDSSRDLDQALHIERGTSRGSEGFTVHYAIADLAAFITPGDPIDVESHRRGQTLYGADSKIPLHPPAISEDAGSLLPDQVRPALLWTIEVDDTGEGVAVEVVRARVRSVAKLSYDQAQAAIDSGSDVPGGDTLRLLKEVGELRLARDARNGAVALPLPEQEIDISDDGTWRLEFRSMLPVEEWNAQISLLTGFAAASLMVAGKVGLLRTMPPPDPRDVKRLRRTARALGVSWPPELDYPEFIRSLDAADPAHAAVIVASARLLRGSGYVAFDGDLPEEREQSALASEYAHVTAPLRRLADRYAGEVCVALCAGEPVPSWVLEALPELPAQMQSSGQKAGAYERAVIDLVEAGLFQRRVGEEFDGVVVSVEEKDDRRGKVSVGEIGVEAPIEGTAPLPLGDDIRVRLDSVDVGKRQVRFVPA
ncbi:RNB domain-containing ribonuclease [Nocardioides sp. GXZ039]|uniref:RNB domain-containing ribonuclease n=1 Tax=Nocardioides sp. GXZ039 TaxID=3136018 RepID=UPI0030F42049